MYVYSVLVHLLIPFSHEVMIQYLVVCTIILAHFCCRCSEDDSSCYSSHDGNKGRNQCNQAIYSLLSRIPFFMSERICSHKSDDGASPAFLLLEDVV